MDGITKKAEGYFKALPTNFQKAINESSWKDNVRKIVAENNLGAEKTTSLETETMLVLYGIEEAEDYISNLIQELDLSEQEAVKIANTITTSVFEPIIQKAKELEKEEPIIITKETKEEVVKELNRRSEEIQNMQASLVQRTKPTTNDQRPTTETKILEIAPEIHPVIEPREVVHEVPHVESKQTSNLQTSKPQTVSVPDYRYPKGKDPYREPIDN